RADYIKAVWNIANWQNVAERLAAATSKTQGLISL
ncbi:Fe-Mn family superoxide dismutase, partial [Herbiconiux sp. CPCC 203407]|nr:Fe-Mn family superoxide dismutase [Herbiconiux oxytropis]MCS5727170.1 Fe-Mn family superoxide dismutase [Herbiconiux oxytropis]